MNQLTIKLMVKPYLEIQTALAGQGHLEIEIAPTNLRGLLENLSQRFGPHLAHLLFAFDQADLKPHLQVLINGRNYRYLPHGLDTPLADGDEIVMFPLVDGG